MRAADRDGRSRSGREQPIGMRAASRDASSQSGCEQPVGMRAADRDGRGRSGREQLIGTAIAESRNRKEAPQRNARSTPSWRSCVSRSGPVVRTLGSFCKRGGVFKGIPSLCKCYIACKVWHRCESGGIAAKVGIRRVGIAVKTAHGGRLPGPGARRPRGIAVRTGPAPPPLSNETHWGRKPPIGVGNLPTPMPSCLPQCGKARYVACPNAGARPPAVLSAPRPLRAPLRIWAGAIQNASGFRCFRRAPHVGGPKCV